MKAHSSCWTHKLNNKVNNKGGFHLGFTEDSRRGNKVAVTELCSFDLMWVKDVPYYLPVFIIHFNVLLEFKIDLETSF